MMKFSLKYFYREGAWLRPWVDIDKNKCPASIALTCFLVDADLDDLYSIPDILNDIEKTKGDPNRELTFGGHGYEAVVKGNQVYFYRTLDDYVLIGECSVEDFEKALRGFTRLINMPRSPDSEFILEF